MENNSQQHKHKHINYIIAYIYTQITFKIIKKLSYMIYITKLTMSQFRCNIYNSKFSVSYKTLHCQSKFNTFISKTKRNTDRITIRIKL